MTAELVLSLKGINLEEEDAKVYQAALDALKLLTDAQIDKLFDEVQNRRARKIADQWRKHGFAET
jgi:CRISPR/Cas system CSM-associated protein Csm2 small subunit